MQRIQKTFKNNWPTIYLVATPIGNISDMSKRAIETLNQVDFVYCEDTRTSGVLFSELGLQVKTRSLHKFNELAKVDEIKQLLAQGLSIALVSDAGVPGINDPGMYLLHELGQDEQLNYNLTAVGVGPAYVHALIASGFFFEKHFYIGFLDRREQQIKNELLNILAYAKKGESISICLYESVHRIKKTLEIIATVFSELDANLAICRELTKLNEEIVRLKVSEIPAYLADDVLVEKGEFCLVLNFKQETIKTAISEDEIVKMARDLINIEGLRKKDALKTLKKQYDFDLEKLFKII
jgi:16S rRNA (cytidine1402-2'-O)-methyltransferase